MRTLQSYFMDIERGGQGPVDIAWIVPWIAAGLAAVGIVLAWDAYRYWLNADLA
jgi:hypothetical protein